MAAVLAAALRGSRTSKAQALKDQEQRDYNAVATFYDRDTTPLTDLFGSAAVERLGLREGQRVLEIACGSGTLLPELAARVGPSGAVTGIDLAANMVALARKRIAACGLENVQVQEGDAETLAGIKSSTYDRVLSVFGFMYLPDPLLALRRVREVLVPGGLAVICVWGRPEDVPGLTVPMEAGAQVLLPPPLNWLIRTAPGRWLLSRQLLLTKPGGGRSPMSLGTARLLDGLLEDAGFVDIRREEQSCTFAVHFESYWTVLLGTPARVLLQRQTRRKRERVKAQTCRLLTERFSDDSGELAIPMGAVLVTGCAPEGGGR